MKQQNYIIDSRTIQLKEEDYDLLKPLIDKIKSKKENYFLTFRNNQITIYYKSLVLLYITKKKDKMMITLRKKSSTSTKEDILVYNKEYIEKLKEANLLKNEKIEEIELTKDFNLEIIDIITNWIDQYWKNKKVEKMIQSNIACIYQDIKEDLICIDMEYIEKVSSGAAKKIEINSKGRYDYIFLKKEKEKYIVLFGELKCTDEACTNPLTGIINHVNDMFYFLDNYNKNIEYTQDKIKESILFTLKAKHKFGLIKEITEQEIDFRNPKFALIFAKTPKLTKLPIPKGILNEIIVREIELARGSKSKSMQEKMAKNPIKIGEELIPKNKITKNQYQSVIDRIKYNEIYIYNETTKTLEEVKK